ncbi:MAG TPA: helix-turn-helix domain-containing protein [Acidimicrobiales bacterium]
MGVGEQQVTVVGSGPSAAHQLGAAVRAARKDAGLTQSELGELIDGMPRHMLADVENGRLTRQAQRLLAIFDAVGLELVLQPRSARLAAGERAAGAESS